MRELIDKPRPAHTRLAHERHHLAVVLLSPCERLAEGCQLGLATYKGGQASCGGNL